MQEGTGKEKKEVGAYVERKQVRKEASTEAGEEGKV